MENVDSNAKSQSEKLKNDQCKSFPMIVIEAIRNTISTAFRVL
jgi:hypothetical protein